jgi:hypothetical protein
VHQSLLQVRAYVALLQGVLHLLGTCSTTWPVAAVAGQSLLQARAQCPHCCCREYCTCWHPAPHKLACRCCSGCASPCRAGRDACCTGCSMSQGCTRSHQLAPGCRSGCSSPWQGPLHLLGTSPPPQPRPWWLQRPTAHPPLISWPLVAAPPAAGAAVPGRDYCTCWAPMRLQGPPAAGRADVALLLHEPGLGPHGCWDQLAPAGPHPPLHPPAPGYGPGSPCLAAVARCGPDHPPAPNCDQDCGCGPAHPPAVDCDQDRGCCPGHPHAAGCGQDCGCGRGCGSGRGWWRAGPGSHMPGSRALPCGAPSAAALLGPAAPGLPRGPGARAASCGGGWRPPPGLCGRCREGAR